MLPTPITDPMRKRERDPQPKWLYVFPIFLGLLAIAVMVLLIVLNR